jgi:hypothetical protein
MSQASSTGTRSSQMNGGKWLRKNDTSEELPSHGFDRVVCHGFHQLLDPDQSYHDSTSTNPSDRFANNRKCLLPHFAFPAAQEAYLLARDLVDSRPRRTPDSFVAGLGKPGRAAEAERAATPSRTGSAPDMAKPAWVSE